MSAMASWPKPDAFGAAVVALQRDLEQSHEKIRAIAVQFEHDFAQQQKDTERWAATFNRGLVPTGTAPDVADFKLPPIVPRSDVFAKIEELREAQEQLRHLEARVDVLEAEKRAGRLRVGAVADVARVTAQLVGVDKLFLCNWIETVTAESATECEIEDAVRMMMVELNRAIPLEDDEGSV